MIIRRKPKVEDERRRRRRPTDSVNSFQSSARRRIISGKIYTEKELSEKKRKNTNERFTKLWIVRRERQIFSPLPRISRTFKIYITFNVTLLKYIIPFPCAYVLFINYKRKSNKQRSIIIWYIYIIYQSNYINYIIKTENFNNTNFQRLCRRFYIENKFHGE